jgi:hypothetical protein
VIIFKTITPKRLQPDVFRQEILNELRKVEKLVLKDYQKTTATWTHKIVFESGIRFPQGSPGVYVETTDKIYGYVTYGTKPHVITAKRPGGVLAFKSGYNAKTTPRVIGSQAGGAFGETVFARSVQHPGTEAREFHETIHAKWVDLFAEHMQDALDRGAKKCGHGIST